MEEKITFFSETYEIEGRLSRGVKEEKGIVIAHPHPLYGGNMYNDVTEAVAHVFQRNGYTTLRFNFRGVGKSQGAYDNGMGEQKDILAARSYLSESGIRDITLAGYSFGAWVISRIACEEHNAEKRIMISPPAAFMEFHPVIPLPCLDLVVVGSEDEFAPVHLVESLIAEWHPRTRFEIIHGADHFYGGTLKHLASCLSDYII